MTDRQTDGRTDRRTSCDGIVHAVYCIALCGIIVCPVLCYAWTEYKFTCACVCTSVCIYVTLSVKTPTGQTPQQSFTGDSLQDTDLRTDVPLGGLDDE